MTSCHSIFFYQFCYNLPFINALKILESSFTTNSFNYRSDDEDGDDDVNVGDLTVSGNKFLNEVRVFTQATRPWHVGFFSAHKFNDFTSFN